MEDPILFYTIEEVQFFEKPYFDGKNWYGLERTDNNKIFLTETRAAALGYPVQHNEEPSGYIYTPYGYEQYKYIPVYCRSKYNLDHSKLYPNEYVKYKKNNKKKF